MISKYYEIEKYKSKTSYFLFYGENEGQKQDIIQANFAQFTTKTERGRAQCQRFDLRWTF